MSENYTIEDTEIVMATYGKLYDVMVNEYLNGDKANEAYTYTQVAFKFITGCTFEQAIAKYSASLIAGTINIFLAEHDMECTCPPDWMSEDCFPCNVDKQAKKELKARHNLVRQGVLHEQRIDNDSKRRPGGVTNPG
jgi:hypothetical protein